MFSPNGDGVQDNLIISFVTNGFTGDYRIMIDVHGPGAVGRPDGVFDIDDDWMVIGAVGPGPSEFYPENNPKIIHQEWDGMDRAPSQDAPPSARPVRNGNYEIRVETDAFEDGAIDIINPTYQSSTLVAVVDIDAPQISSTASHLFFSPNSDTIKDTTTITYALSEHLSDLRLEFSNFENQPAIKLTQITRGRQSFVWSGLDGLRTPLIDGVYSLRLRGVDNGGNVTTFDVGAVQIDTKAPTFTQITPSRDAYLKTSIAAIEVEFNLAEQDSPINFDSSVTTIGLQNAGGETVSGIIRSDVTNNRLTLALDNPLDTISENGTYTAVILVADEAGNQAATESSFNFDTVPPTLQRIRSNYGNFPPNGSVNTKITFVEVDLDDNIDDGLNLAASTIALNGPNGAIFGNQTFGGDSTLRWNLEAPIAADGSEDGIYTITISVADRAGNTANFGEISFVYDTQAPRLDSLKPNLEDSSFHLGAGTIYRSQPLLQVVAGFDDGAGSGVDFASSSLEIFRLDETGSGNIFLTGTRHVNPTDGTLAFLLSQPLENQDGTQDGAYTIRVSSADVAGNTSTSRVDLIYDTEAPTIVSVAPERDATVTTLSQVTLVMDDSMSGVDFANTILRLVRDDVEIRGTSSNNGKDTEVLTLSNPLVTDGSDDGEYRIEITTVDRAGNASDLVERRFYFVSQPPEIRLNAPATGVINEFTTIDAQLVNYIGTGIDFSPEKSSVIVTHPDGTVLPSASVEADNVNNRLVWMAKTPLPRDGSADGEYTVRVNYENFVGQNFTQDFALIFDTQLPGVAQTTPTPGARVSRLGTVTVEFTPDLSGVDFAAAQVRLLDPNGVPVGTNRSDNGVDVITLRVQDIQTSTTEGIYTIEVTPADRAGNVADSPYLSSFTFAPREPSITLEPTDNAPTNQLRQITATLQEYVGPGIDFDSAETSISVRDALGSVVTAQPIQPNAAELQLTWTVLSPLPRDGSADGTYEVMARFVESPDLGTTSPTTFERTAALVFDTQPAHILSTNPTRNARITHFEHATIELGDDLSGVDFNNTLIQLVDPSNNSIPTNIRNDGEKRITLSFDAFKTDGSADGVYRLEITPVDLAGNVGGLSTVEFVYATLAPEIEMLTPADESVVNRVPEIRALIHDHSGEGIDLKKSMISLSGPDGADVRGVRGDDEERTLTLRLGLPTDGSADGTYTVNLNLVDNLGIEAAYMRHFTYDSVPPKIVTESLPPRENVIDDHRIIVEFEVTDASPGLEAGSGVDFDATSVQLQDPNGELIAGEMKDDGVSVITFTSAELASVGVYTLTIVVADRAGNLSVPQQFTYRDVILPPRVVSFSPPAKSRLNRLTEISVVIEDQSGRGIDFSSTGSTIELHNPDGVQVGGIVTNNGVDTLTFHLIDPLLTDGSEDGVYTIVVQPMDRLGVSGEVRQVAITYDTQSPRVQSVSHIDMTANVSRVKDSVRRIEVELTEANSGIDFGSSNVQLWRHTESDRVLVPGTLDYDDASLLWWQLDSPLARSGEDDGAYTVEVVASDNAGNVEENEYRLLYDTQAPVIGSIQVYVVAGDALELDTDLAPSNNRIIIEFEVTDESPALGAESGVDLDATTIQLQDSNGELIAGDKKDDGEKKIIFTSVELTSVGAYTVTITAADYAGNVNVGVPQRFTYRDEIKPPRVVSFSPPAKSRLNRLTEISVVIEDQSGRGIDFSSTGSTIELHSPDDVQVGGIVTNNGVDTLTFHLIDPLLTDGSEDGVYTIVVQPMDRLGVSGEVRQVAITYDTQSPRVQSVSHIDMTANVSRVKDSVRRIEVELTEAESGIDVGNSYVQLWRHTEGDRVLVPGTLDYDDASLLWWQLDSPLTQGGEDDGAYTVEVVAFDNAGNVEENEYRLLYDTQAPVIGSIQVYVVAGDALELDTDLAPSNNRIIIEFEVTDESPALGAESGVDLDATSVQLQDSNGELIAGDKKDDGEKKITFTSVELTSVGAYTVTITAADYAGNVNVGVPQRFTYRDEIKPPRVVSFSPPAKSRLNRLTEISAVIEDQSGRGIDFSSTGSTVELRSPDDVVVEGNIVNDGVNTITLRLLDPLLTDGSDDGVYVITVQPVDQRGISGEVRQYSVTYDTQKPRVQSVSHIDLTANVSNVRDSVRRVEVELIETGSGIDFERSYVQLWRHTEDERALVPGTLDNDGSLLWLQLENALARNGVDDSAYSVVVSAVDNADNVEEKKFVFLYDTQVPGIDSVKAAAAAGNTLEIGTGSVSTVVGVPIHQIHLAFSDGSGSGIDVSQTTAQLIQPDGTAVAATQQDDGIETVSLRFKPLRDDGTDDGRYFVRVTPIDFSGNTYTSPIEFQFLYSTRKPEVVSTTPAEHESVNFLDSVSVVLIDHSGEGIDFDHSTVGLYNAEGILVEGRQNADTGSSAIAWDLDRPMSRDGVDDGEYSIRLVAFDGAGNELSSSTTILYDSQIPRIVSVSADTIPSTSIPANELVVLNRSFSQMTIGLSDEHADGEKISTSGIDFAGTIVQLVGPDNEQIGVTVSDDGETQLIVNFTPLVKPGAYTLEIIPRDLAGNASGHPIQYKFSLNLAKPRVDSVAIGGRMAPVAFVNQLDKITAKLVDPNGVGLDLTTGGSGLSVIGPNGVVDGLHEGNGVDELDWTPLHLPVDGTADGRYTVTVTPVDNLGLSGAPAIYEFVLDTQQPALVSVDPINLARAVSYIGGQIFQISAQVGDVGPSGLDISTQTITLQDSNGVFIPANLTTDGDSQILLTLVQPLATNGGDDGEYSIVIDLSDRAGNAFKIEHTFVYDTQAPTLVDTDPAGDLIRDDLTSIIAHLSDNGGSGIDFAVSQLTLFDPNGNQVNGQLGNDGVGQLILLLDELAEDGSYRIRVVGVDRAGNGTDAPFERTFLFSTNLPTVVSTVPVTAPAGSAFTRTPPGQVEVEFQSSPNLSTVKLIHPNGTTVPGQQIRDGNRLVYRLSRELASDGSDDGSYTILVTPVNSAGRSGEQLQYNFVYDSVVPEVEGILPVVESPGVNNALNEILVLVTDASPSSSIDWDELDDSWVTFEKIGVEKKIRGRLTTDRDQLISFHLESPLASDGSQDGKYRVIVMPRDRAGNVAIPTAIEFFLDTRPPTIHTDSLLINDRPLFVSTNHPDYPSADGSGSGVVIQARMSDLASDGEPGLGVDLSQSSIVVTAPDDTPVTGNLIQNGTDTIVFRSGPLIAEGFYRVEITSVGLDVDGLGFAPTGSITTQFLHETTEPVAELTDFGGKTSLTDQALPLRGTATDPISIAQEGSGDGQDGPVSASGIAFVEIVGTGPDGEPIEPVLAVDRSGAQSEPWSSWSLDFLPARSGGYNLDVRVTDRAGNVAVYDGVTVNLSVSLTYRGTTYSWPSPLKRSTGDRAHFSFDVNIPTGSKINMTLSIYDFAGDLVFEDTFANISPGRDSDQLVTWNLKNQAGAAVARGIYIFRLEAEDVATKNRSNAVGKMLVIE